MFFYNIPDNNIKRIYTAGENLSGHKIVFVENNIVYYANCNNLEHMYKVIGITSHASDVGKEIIVILFGELEESGWAWNINKQIFLSSNGNLSQLKPNNGFMLQIATPISSTKIFVNIKIPIKIR